MAASAVASQTSLTPSAITILSRSTSLAGMTPSFSSVGPVIAGCVFYREETKSPTPLSRLFLAGHSRLHERQEQRMRSQRPRCQLGMELRTKEEGMLLPRQLHDLHESAVWRDAGKNHTLFFQALDVVGIYFKAVPVALQDRSILLAFN